MVGIKLNFPPNDGMKRKVSFDFTQSIDGFQHTMQKALVNTVTIAGSDTSYPNRGEALQNRLLKGIPYTKADLKHSCNFSALNAQVFTNEQMDESDESIMQYTLTPISGGQGGILLYADFYGSNGAKGIMTNSIL